MNTFPNTLIPKIYYFLSDSDCHTIRIDIEHLDCLLLFLSLVVLKIKLKFPSPYFLCFTAACMFLEENSRCRTLQKLHMKIYERPEVEKELPIFEAKKKFRNKVSTRVDQSPSPLIAMMFSIN